MLHLLHTPPFPCCVFLRSNVFILTFFSCYTLFMHCSISCCTFTRCNVFVLHSSPVALLACCNFFLFHFVHFALFPEVKPGAPQASRMKNFAAIINKAVKHCFKPLHLWCSQGSCYTSIFSMSYFFHVALFSCCTFSMLHIFHIALFPCCTFSMSHFFHVTLFPCCTVFSFHVTLFSCCTCLLLKNIENERKIKNTIKKRPHT